MMNLRLLMIAALAASLSACTGFGTKQDAEAATPAEAKQPQAEAAPAPQYPTESAVYACENVSAVRVTRTEDSAQPHLKITWLGREYTMLREEGQGSGLPRFSDRANGLTWVDLPWKGVLLNSRTEKPILSDCKPASGEDLVQANKILDKHAADYAKAQEKAAKSKKTTKKTTKKSSKKSTKK
ncbi:MAG: hypothetical protein IK051_09210 [Rhodocyclaceae bacterium]|nr:hypothetical protein [Rhodocyclaceae bacterium]MBR4737828.1 hypothetical protein [Rhodocyclaceae bacterium]